MEDETTEQTIERQSREIENLIAQCAMLLDVTCVALKGWTPMTVKYAHDRINQDHDMIGKHGGRIGALETDRDKMADSVAKARTAFDSLRREVRANDFKTQSPPAKQVEQPTAAGPRQATETNRQTA